MFEPGTVAGALNTLKNFPVWFLSSITLALCLFLWLPVFAGIATGETRSWAIFAAIAFFLMTVCRIISSSISFLIHLRQKHEASRTFHLAPVDRECYWHLAKQKDDTVLTQIHISFTAKNLSKSAVYLLKARLISPKISDQITHDMVSLRAPDNNIYGTAHTSGHFIPVGRILPGSINLMIRGVPKKKTETMKAVFAVQDADGHELRFKVNLRKV